MNAPFPEFSANKHKWNVKKEDFTLFFLFNYFFVFLFVFQKTNKRKLVTNLYIPQASCNFRMPLCESFPSGLLLSVGIKGSDRRMWENENCLSVKHITFRGQRLQLGCSSNLFFPEVTILIIKLLLYTCVSLECLLVSCTLTVDLR